MPHRSLIPTEPLLARLQSLLPYVKNPGRYVGGEANQVVKEKANVLADMALLFPDIYELGMSHNGTKVLYHLLNREPDLAAERAFAPMLDMAERMRAAALPLYALESYRPVRDFTAIGISLQTELNYTNVPFVLELAGLAPYAADRLESDPFIIGGGPCMANPEPVADFFDLFVIGDGEVLAPAILRRMGEGRQKGESKEQVLLELSKLKGVYVPRFLATALNARGEVVPDVDGSVGPYWRAKGVQRTWVEVLNREDYPTKNLVPHMKLVHDRFSVEVMRGCTQGCRFCQAGYWYRPNRELNADAVIDLAKAGMAMTGEREIGLLSLSTADYGQVEKVLDALIEDEDFNDIDLSLPSLRANSYGQGIATKAAALTGGKSATFAPETGSERLRKLINKTISDADMIEAAENVFKNGFHNIKLYTMVGLPTEDLDDMRAFCGLIEQLHAVGQRYGRRNTVHANIGILVPKPFTPMQWVPFMDEEKVMRHIQFVRERFRRVATVRITWADWGLAQVESFYSRGDRSQSALILEAARRGQIFESHGEFFKHQGWLNLWKEKGVNPEAMYQYRSLDEIFPWDFIHAGTTKGYLKHEYKQMFKADAPPVPDCKWGECQKCGIPGNYADIKLSEPPQIHQAPSRTPLEIKALAQSRREGDAGRYPYQMIFRKTGMSRFIAHQNTIDILEKAFRRLKVKLGYSDGFNPKPLIKNLGALPLGLESRRELLVIELRSPVLDLGTRFCQALTQALPEGMDVLEFYPVDSVKVPRIATVTYRSGDWNGSGVYLDVLAQVEMPESQKSDLPISELFSAALARWEAGVLTQPIQARDKEIILAAEVETVWLEAGELCVRIKAHDSGASVSPYLVYGALLGRDPESLRPMPIYKADFALGESRHQATQGLGASSKPRKVQSEVWAAETVEAIASGMKG